MTSRAGTLTIRDWSSLVTAALLGTDRRPLTAIPGQVSASSAGDAVAELLDRAAAHRTVALTAAPMPRCPAPATAPAERLPPAPAAACALLGQLLALPEPALVNLWLATCARRRLGAPVEYWPRLAEVAARSTAYDRRVLGQALGPRGRWFLAQHPRWARLVSPADPDSDLFAAAAEVSLEEWENVLHDLTGGSPETRRRERAHEVALGIPLAHGRVLLEQLELAGPVVHRNLVLLRRMLAARVQIHDAFAQPGAAPPEPAQPRSSEQDLP